MSESGSPEVSKPPVSITTQEVSSSADEHQDVLQGLKKFVETTHVTPASPPLANPTSMQEAHEEARKMFPQLATNPPTHGEVSINQPVQFFKAPKEQVPTENSLLARLRRAFSPKR